MKIQYSKTAIKALGRLDNRRRALIKSGIEGITEEPPQGDIKPLNGQPGFRLRIGAYRVLYVIEDGNGEKMLKVRNIGARGDIYK